MTRRAVRRALVPGCLVVASVAGPSSAAAQDAVDVVAFRPEARVRATGDSAVSELVVLARAGVEGPAWVGYSLQDPAGRWHDVEPRAVTLPAAARAPLRMAWRVPADTAAPSGDYRVVMAVWSKRPGAAGSVRLASADRRAAFRVRRPGDPVALEEGGPWRAATHALGRGRMRPEAVSRAGAAGVRLRLVPDRCDGAEVRTAERHGHGEYGVRMRTPDAPGSLSAFFLYRDVAGEHDEIDVEIYNDGTRRVILAAYVAGKMTRNAEVVLPFDPRAGVHEYTIRWSARELAFLADGRVLQRWTERFPAGRPMRVMANLWYPKWLECGVRGDVRDLLIERFVGLPAPR